MANPTILEKIQSRFNAKRVENSLPVVDFTGYTMSNTESYSGPQSTSDTLIYANPLPSINCIFKNIATLFPSGIICKAFSINSCAYL